MRLLLSVSLALALAMPVYAASVDYTITLDRKQQAALEIQVKRFNDAHADQTGDPENPQPPPTTTADEIVQNQINSLKAHVVEKMRRLIEDVGITLAPAEIIPLPIIVGDLHIFEVAGSRTCFITLEGGIAGTTEQYDSHDKCGGTKDTANSMNIYWDIIGDRYEVQNTFPVSITIRMDRLE